jgi:hypothetical protein
MKKAFITLAMITVAGFGLVSSVMAKNYGLTTAASQANYSVSDSANVYAMTQLVISGILATIGFVFFGFFIFAGLRWMTAQGNSEKIERAKATMISTVLGLVVILAAYGLTNFVFDQLSK